MKKVVLQPTDVYVTDTNHNKLYALISRKDDVFVLTRDVNLDRYDWRHLGSCFTNGGCHADLTMQGIYQDHPRIAIRNALKKFYDVFEFDSWAELITWKDSKPKSRWRLIGEAPKSSDDIWAIVGVIELKICWSDQRTNPGPDYHSYGAD